MTGSVLRVAQVLFLGGPADGAVRELPADGDGYPAELLVLRSDGVFVGAGDDPAPTTLAAYRRVPHQRVEQYQLYEHVGNLTG